MQASLDTGSLMADRANAAIAQLERALDEWAESTSCSHCEHCEWAWENDEDASGYRFGWCHRNGWLLRQDDLDRRIADWGCFDD